MNVILTALYPHDVVTDGGSLKDSPLHHKAYFRCPT